MGQIEDLKRTQEALESASIHGKLMDDELTRALGGAQDLDATIRHNIRTSREELDATRAEIRSAHQRVTIYLEREAAA